MISPCTDLFLTRRLRGVHRLLGVAPSSDTVSSGGHAVLGKAVAGELKSSQRMKKILVTGANGFVGKALCERLVAEGHSVMATVRSPESELAVPPGIEAVFTKPLAPETDWSDAAQRAEIVVHLAARVHVMHEATRDPLAEFRRVNVHATRRLAEAAIAAGVKRFVFLSSIGVNGNATRSGKPFSETDEPAPHNPYSLSKLEAERTIRQVTAGSEMEAVFIRAPLVYGPCNPGNALRLFEAVHKAWPLPFASVRNSRSLIYLDNLVDAITTCCVHCQAAGQIYFVSDWEDVSTPELIRRIAAAFGATPRLFPFPPAFMLLAGTLLGKRSAVERVIGSLTLDSSKIRRELGWKPPYTMEQGLQATAMWYLANHAVPRLVPPGSPAKTE